VTGKPLVLAVSATGIGIILVGTLVLHSAGAPPPAPARPEIPPPLSSLINTEQRYSPLYYRALVEQDAKFYNVPAPAYEDLQQPNPYFEELRTKKRLRIKSPFETRHLRISLEVTKEMATLANHTLNSDHLTLRIENRTQLYLAYRIPTSVPDKEKCANKANISHNAVMIEPGQTITRTECLYRKDEQVDLLGIEVIELPPLSAYYISRLPPSPVLYDPRTFAGHMPPKAEICSQTFSWRDIKDGIEKQAFGWRDVIDFYARHNCSEYTFFKSYRYRGNPSDPLPARALD
jgi:hypothetical protein